MKTFKMPTMTADAEGSPPPPPAPADPSVEAANAAVAVRPGAEQAALSSSLSLRFDEALRSKLSSCCRGDKQPSSFFLVAASKTGAY